LLAEPLVFQGDPLDDSGCQLELLTQLRVLLAQPRTGFLELVVAAGRQRGLPPLCRLASEVAGDVGEIAPESGVGQAQPRPSASTAGCRPVFSASAWSWAKAVRTSSGLGIAGRAASWRVI
jgi:hypothetical protein